MQHDSAHLTYCTNIHAGESWAEVRSVLETHVLAVKKRVSPDAPFGVGLRLSAQALEELSQRDQLGGLCSWLEQHGLYVFTLNVFPYGTFHGTRVKENVYRPDWREDERVAYTDQAARVLARLLEVQPEGATGSLSTVPGAFRPRASSKEAVETLAANLVRHAATLVELERSTGRLLRLALEPEPSCFLETTHEAATFIKDHLWSKAARARLADLTGVDEKEAERALRRHLGVCFDACHAAVEFEDVDASLDELERDGIVVAKWQISSGLRVREPDRESLEALGAFFDDVYLHQVVVRQNDELLRFVDLPEAMSRAPSGACTEWRVHFHVPIFRRDFGRFEGTQDVIEAMLARHERQPVSSHLEVETYTWDVLPERFRDSTVDEAVSRELCWVRDRLSRQSQ